MGSGFFVFRVRIRLLLAAWFVFVLCWLGGAWLAEASPLQLQKERWAAARIRPDWEPLVKKALWNFERDKARYERVERMRKTGVPALVVFCLHGRESTWSFRRHLHEGSPLTGRTKYIPKGRPKKGSPPFSWEESAEDALYILKDLENRVDWSDLPAALQAIEAFNGLGYQKYRPTVASPYLWSGTNVYTRGKYVADGRFDRLAVDKQLGCAAILKMAGEAAWLRQK